MLDTLASAGESDVWSELLQQTRQALTMLRADMLEELAARAQSMLAASQDNDSAQCRIALPSNGRMSTTAREFNLLRDLLAASDRNLRVLRATRQDKAQGPIKNARVQWAR